jgi:hypothetical protein
MQTQTTTAALRDCRVIAMLSREGLVELDQLAFKAKRTRSGVIDWIIGRVDIDSAGALRLKTTAEVQVNGKV